MSDLNIPLTTWRLLQTPPAPGPWNMAVDEAILESIGAGECPPTLRLYAWSPPCLSLGYAQPFSDVDRHELSSRGWDIVRRITGGRAILHADELTYAVIAPYEEPRLAGSLLESYRRLSLALLQALIYLGLPANAFPKPKTEDADPPNQKPVCFEVPSNYEITVHGKKLVGSAQARKKQGILQHGTLPLYGDLTRIIQVLDFPNGTSRAQAQASLLSRAANIETLLGTPISWADAAAAFIQGFRESLNISFEDSTLSSAELARVERLVKGKYAHPSWVERI